MFLFTLSLLSLLVPTISALVIPRPTPTFPLDRRAPVNPTPAAQGDPTNGWKNLPSAPDSDIKSTWAIEDADFVSLLFLLRRVAIG